jgi:hypothetical protein
LLTRDRESGQIEHGRPHERDCKTGSQAGMLEQDSFEVLHEP